jgi:hypothetical protein
MEAMTGFKHPPTPPAIPNAGELELPVRRIEQTASAYYPDVPGARLLAEAGVLAELVEGLRERYGPAIAEQAARVRHRFVHRPPAWPGDSARVWVTVVFYQLDTSQ